MRMARVNVYLPDDLAERARAANLNVSALAQRAITDALGTARVDEWLDRRTVFPGAGVPHDAALEALHQARGEFGT